jgi:2-phospho-L-lactate/phosphoenolpyruvate guanylyltransferase
VNVALVPAKPLSLAKTRLGTLLGDVERAAVSRAMFTDVLAAVTAAKRIDRVLAVTADPVLGAQAHAAGAVFIDEGAPRGLNGAVALGTEAAVRFGAECVLVVLSDVPLLRGADVDALVERATRPGIVLVPSKEGTGTNAILRCPAGVISPCFGGRSLERHVVAAERAGVACTIWRNVRIGFDVDSPADLSACARADATTATHREAVRMGLAALRPTG